MKENEKKKLGLYIHIPFCEKKCEYCDFYSFKCPSAELAKSYVSALRIQMEDYKKDAADYEADTVYIGGGTPSTLPIPQLKKILSTARRSFDITEDAEITMEVNPGTVDGTSLKKYRRMGINRLSIGVQSANDKELASLGRIHTFDAARECFAEAREAGFTNISVDLMYGIPHQTKNSFMETLDRVVSLGPEHISVYGLKIEEGTPFAEKRDSLPLPDEDSEYEMYLTAISFLEERGYEHYEISNFARPGYRSRHNMKYWNSDEYLGFGASAHSYFGGRRFAVVRDAVKYIDGVEIVGSGINIYSENNELSILEQMCEYIMLRMRLSDGVVASKFNRRFGFDFEENYGKKLREYMQGDFVRFERGVYSLSPKGMYVSNYILSSVLDFEPGNTPT